MMEHEKLDFLGLFVTHHSTRFGLQKIKKSHGADLYKVSIFSTNVLQNELAHFLGKNRSFLVHKIIL